MTELNKKKIIFIHGLASKPPEEKIHTFWQRCITESIRVEDPKLANQIDKQTQNLFEMAYWANATPHHIEDESWYVSKLEDEINEVIRVRKKSKDDFHVGTGKKIEAFFADKGVHLLHLLTGALQTKNVLFKRFLQEIKLYQDEQYIADRMRAPLEEALRNAWDNQQEVALISHSMGSFIAYDVLWRFSHRSEEKFKRYAKNKVKIFATLGSPLGDPAIQELLFSSFHDTDSKRHFPNNIEFWHNYACLGDVVSHYNTFEDVFFKPMRKLQCIKGKEHYHTIDYINLHNPFRVVAHPENKKNVKENPHKSYGYLVQPRLATWLMDFLKEQLVSTEE